MSANIFTNDYYSTWKIIEQDCKLWIVVNGTGYFNTTALDYQFTKIKGDISNIWQFAVDPKINAPVVYEGPKSSHANAALELKIISVSNPEPSPPPRNSTKCLKADDYWNGNQSNWQFGFTRKHETNYRWLVTVEDIDPLDRNEFNWYATKIRYSPESAGGVAINK